MVEYAQNMGQADIILCNRNFIEEDNTVVAHPDAAFLKAWKNRLFEGNRVLRVCLESGCNLLGSLTTMMFCRDKVKLSMEKLKCYEVDDSPVLCSAWLILK